MGKVLAGASDSVLFQLRAQAPGAHPIPIHVCNAWQDCSRTLITVVVAPQAAVRIERAAPGDLAALPGIEREAAKAFEGWNLPPAAMVEVTPLAELRRAQSDGLLWVARDGDGHPAGFALVEMLDGLPHLEEIDVHPAHARRGVGRALVAEVLAWARASGHAAVTLTSFRDVPWNAPFYARLGFRILAPGELTPGLAAILRDEAVRGFDPARRVAMRCELGAGGGGGDA